MKRILIGFLASLIAVTTMSAQDSERKQYLPEAGDYSIGIDIKPLFKYVSGLFNNYDRQTDLDFGGGQPSIYRPDLETMTDAERAELLEEYDDYLKYYPTVSVVFKYMITDRIAFKTNVGVLFDTDKAGSYSPDQQALLIDPLSNAKVVDLISDRKLGLSVQAGMEHRVGKKRIQGVFGYGLMFGFAGHSRNYSYGNEMTLINQWPEGSITGSMENYRILKEYTTVPDMFAGVYGSAGVECFVAPKIALGAEVSLCAGYQINPQKYELSEGYNQYTEVIEQHTELLEPFTASFQMSTRSLGGSLYLAFYF